MDKIYCLNTNDKAVYNEINSAFSTVFPDFDKERETDEEGELITIYKKDNEYVSVGISHSQGITLTMPQGKDYNDFAEIWTRQYKTSSSKDTDRNTGNDILDALTGCNISRIIKFVVVPIVLTVIALLFDRYMLTYIGEGFMMILLLFVHCGGLLLIPASYFSLQMIKADKKPWRLPLSIWLIIDAVLLWVFGLDGIMGLNALTLFVYILSFLLPVAIYIYIYLLPLIISDDILRRYHDHITEKPEPIASRVIYWCASMAAAVLAVIVIGTIASADKIKADRLEKEERDRYETEQAEIQREGAAHIREVLNSDIQTVLDYSSEHNIDSLKNCPDESIEQEWQRLFSEDDEFYVEEVISYDDSSRPYISVGLDECRYYAMRTDSGLSISSRYYREDITPPEAQREGI